MITFQATKHQQLWVAMKSEWHLVRKFGIHNTKLYLLHSVLHDMSDIFNLCYACDYDNKVANHHNERHSCKYCPIHIDYYNNVCSVLHQMSSAVRDNDRGTYEQLCEKMAAANIRPNVPYE